MNIKGFDVSYHTATLKNGSRVVLYKKKGSPIYIQAGFVAGSFSDPSGQEGLAHFFEHLMALGRKNFESKELMAEYIESVGGMYSAYTSKEILSVRVQVPEKSDLYRSIKILDSMICDPVFNQDDIEKERGVIFSEIDRYESDINMMLFKKISNRIFRDTSFEKDIIGTKDSVRGIDIDSLNSFKQKYLVAENLTFVVSGDIEIDELLEKLNNLKILNSSSKYIYPEVKINNTSFDFELPESKQSNIYFGFKEVSPSIKDINYRRVILGILSGSRNSRIIKRLRTEEGLIYSASPFVYSAFDNCIFGVHVPIPKEHLTRGIVSLKEIFQELSDKGILQEELDFIKNKFIKSKKIQMQTAESWVSFHARGEILNLQNKENIDQYIEGLSNIKLEDVNDYIKENISLEKVCIFCSK